MSPLWAPRPAFATLLLALSASLVPIREPAVASSRADPATDSADPATASAVEDSSGVGTVVYALPPAQTIERLNQNHSSDHWLIVSTTGGEMRLRADRFTPQGLVGIHAREELSSPVLEWKHIAKIERRTSGFRAGQVLGGAVCTLIPVYVVSTVAGAWVGAKLGDSIARTTTVYEGTQIEGAITAPDLETAVAAPTTQIQPAAAAPDPDLDRIARNILPGRTVHVWGGFGEFTGTLDAVDSDGLHGPHPDRSLEEARGAPPDPIAWSQISGIVRRGHSGPRGAVFGALVLGAGLGGVAAGLTQSELGSGDDKDAVGAFFAVGAAGALLGAALGHAIGRRIAVWEPVWSVPAPLAGASGTELSPTSGGEAGQARAP